MKISYHILDFSAIDFAILGLEQRQNANVIGALNTRDIITLELWNF